jgi:bifunctional ADP-heptose synthase (sugar kinase/adenylyltransferase)
VDTRTKILTPAALAALDPPRPLLLAAGRFDILRAEMARELTAVRERTGAQSLVAVVRPLEGALAPLDARAEMAAALRVVDYVLTLETEDLDSLVSVLQPIEIVNLEEADTHRLWQLVEDVRRRKL